MEKGILDFDNFLHSLKIETQGLDLVTALNVVSQHVVEEFGVRVWFVEILGRRWSYIAGNIYDHPTPTEVFRIPLEADLGLVSDNWENFSEVDRERFIEFLNRVILFKKGREGKRASV